MQSDAVRDGEYDPRSGARPNGRTRRVLAAEHRRLVDHFGHVLYELRGRDVRSMAPARRSRRAALIGELERYAAAGRFPRNLDFPTSKMPYFVDAFGTRCAMAHLVESSGEAAVVARVANHDNNAFVAKLAHDGAFRAWLDHHGLAAEEAARVQPGYCFVRASECGCNSVGSAQAVARGTVTETDGASATFGIEQSVGDAQLAAVDTEVTVGVNQSGFSVAPGDELIATGSYGSNGPYWTVRAKVDANDLVVVPGFACGDVPETTAEVYFDALASGSYEACIETLSASHHGWSERVDAWSGGPCGGNGCTTAGSVADAGLLGAAALVVGLGAVRFRWRWPSR